MDVDVLRHQETKGKYFPSQIQALLPLVGFVTRYGRWWGFFGSPLHLWQHIITQPDSGPSLPWPEAEAFSTKLSLLFQTQLLK